MGFDIKVNGEVVHTVDLDHRLVTGVHVFTPAGEVAASGLPMGQDSINIEFDYMMPNSLPILEENQRLKEAEEKDEPLFFNLNAQREEALKAVDADFAERSADSDEDLSVEYTQARADVLTDSDARNSALGVKKPVAKKAADKEPAGTKS